MGDKISHNKETRRFEYITPEAVAYLEYEIEPGVLNFTHTIVPKELEGRGIGGTLVKWGLNYAKEQGYKVKPTCWFVNKFVKKFTEYKDMVVEVSDEQINGPVCEI